MDLEIKVFMQKGWRLKMQKKNGLKLDEAVLFTTLEPCIEMSDTQKKQCCADLIIESGIKKVYIGSYDNNVTVNRKGWKRLKDKGITIKDYKPNIREKIKKRMLYLKIFSKKVLVQKVVLNFIIKMGLILKFNYLKVTLEV